MVHRCVGRSISILTIAALLGACDGTQSSGEPAGGAAIERLPSPAAAGSAEPYLASDARGNVFLTWLEPLSDSGHAFRFSRLDAAGRWSAPRTIRSGTDFFVNWADFPSILVIGDGRLAVHWLQRNGRGKYAYGVRIAQSADSGAHWSDPLTPHHDSTATEHGFVALWPEGDGFGAAWLDGRRYAAVNAVDHQMMLMATTVDGTGRSAPERPLDDRTCDCCQNSAAVTSDGPLVAYRNRSPDEIRDIHVTRRVGGRWSAGVPVHADGWRISSCPVNGPAVAARDRRVAVAWFTAASDTPRVNVAFSTDAGATFSVATRVDDGQPAGRVDVELLADGAALVTWIERSGGDTTRVRARRVAPDGTAGHAITVGTSTSARASGFPRMAVSGHQVYFAWTVPGDSASIHIGRRAVASWLQ